MTDAEFNRFLQDRRWKIFALDNDDSLDVNMSCLFGNRCGAIAWKNFWSEVFILAKETLVENNEL